MRLKPSSALVKVIVSWLEYLIILVLLVGGLQTGLQAAYPQITTDHLQEIFGSRLALGIYGTVYFGAGILLLYSKVRDKTRCHGYALMLTYMMSLFGLVLEIQVFRSPFVEFLDTLILTIFSGGIYLRFKYLTR